MIEAIVRTETMEKVKDKLKKLQIGGMTVSDARGRGRSRPLELQFRSHPYIVDLLPRTRFQIVVRDKDVSKVVKTIISTAHTGQNGDGKIFVYPVDEAYDIATKAKGEKAI